MESSIKDYLKLHLVVLIWGFTAILGVLLSFPAVEIVFYRTFLACLIMGAILWYRKAQFRLPPKTLISIVSTGFIISMHWILFFWAARISNVSVALAGFATCSLWTAFLEPLANKSRVKWYELVLGLMVIAGLYVIFSFEFGYWVGLTMAVGSGFLGAVFTIINSKFTKKHSPYILTFYEMGGACLFTLLLFPVYTTFLTDKGLQLAWQGYDWLWLILMAGVCTVYAFSASVELMKRLTAYAINLTVNMEPVYGIVLAFMIFGESEKMTTGFYVGTGIILLSVCLYPIFNYFHKRRKAKQLLRFQ